MTKMLQVLREMNPESRSMKSEVSIPASLKRRGRASIVPPIMELRRAKMVLMELLVGTGLSSSCYRDCVSEVKEGSISDMDELNKC